MSEHLNSPAGRPIRVLQHPDAGAIGRWRQAFTAFRRRATAGVLVVLQVLSKM